MEELKKRILDYLEENYAQTRWRFTTKVRLMVLFGPEAEAVIESLYKEGILYPRRGIQGELCQYIVSESSRQRAKEYYLKHYKDGKCN